jgi:hypothetical protein
MYDHIDIFLTLYLLTIFTFGFSGLWDAWSHIIMLGEQYAWCLALFLRHVTNFLNRSEGMSGTYLSHRGARFMGLHSWWHTYSIC